tara:strand:- start:505 stop:1746 length:1242 start_codon:yes stop_codon:yes gene_type:complete
MYKFDRLMKVVMKKIILIFTLLWSLSAFSQGYLPSKSFNKKGDFYKRTRSIIPESNSLLKYASYTHSQVGATCTNHAAAQGMNILYAQQRKSTNKKENSIHSFSPYYTYISNIDDFNSGMNIQSCLDTLKTIGIPLIGCDELLNYYPFSKDTLNSISKLSKSSKKELIQNAANFKLKKWEKVNNIFDLKESISRGFPVILGVENFDGIGLNYVRECDVDTCLWSIEESDRGYAYPHAVLVTGYDDKIQAVEVLNSWGGNWGENGVFWMKYEDLFPLNQRVDIEISKIDSPFDVKILYYEDENYLYNDNYCWLNIANGKCYGWDRDTIYDVKRSDINEWIRAHNKAKDSSISTDKINFGFCDEAYSMQGISISSEVVFIDDNYIKNISNTKKIEDSSLLNNSKWFVTFKDFINE